ncbi:GDSL esterase/lipase At1g74460 [Amborella trichopoda]|uniref:SGNH hydrolase-type esterase domain-containing protein n=1 Tax=Amborella trichopoda TaxID=13333 RepID=W1NH18_AMBTC|nr:GDSL esterase/lipase At1g74460 [Amborella trichopoda]ERM94504.1 hypothetical protein AMTR_s00010p00262870 [Amborella trichopoda]|eukprot:XP_020521951.1 GDSL esterase/lipase At1g74460 [Amborella trichopoda]
MEAMKMAILMILLLIISEHAKGAIVQFIFGDSLSDVGNNNYLPRSLAKANLPYYGIDFGNGLPNGRYTNGRTVADIIGDKMGLPRPPAFLDPNLTVDMILEKGVNFASGGGGILNETGQWFIQKFCLWKQIELFEGTQQMVSKKIGRQAAMEFFTNSRYVVALGSNDFINNYLMPVYKDSWTYTTTQFIDYLMSTLRQQLIVLHGYGVRQLVFFGLGPMGCIPLERVLGITGGCQTKVNNIAFQFNKAASNLLKDLSLHLPNATYRFGDAYDVVADVIHNPNKYGFENSDSPCCSFGRIRPALTCIPASSLCKDRSKYVFWDEYHPTDAANEIIAEQIIANLGFKPINASGEAPFGAPEPAPSLF